MIFRKIILHKYVGLKNIINQQLAFGMARKLRHGIYEQFELSEKRV
jgi:hypothetical protein